jgi:DNA-directed RNA polymerase specialized sigma24 family protein
VEPERGAADVLGVTKSTVQTHLERALVKLRAALEVTEDV